MNNGMPNRYSSECARRTRAVCLLALGIFIFTGLGGGCKKQGAGENAAVPESNAAAPLFKDTFTGAIDSEIMEIAEKSESVKKIRKHGILRASMKCDRPPMCFSEGDGPALGFEVEILRRVAGALGVKLNIVPAGESADISGPVREADAKGGGFTRPYFYSKETGWLVLHADGDDSFVECLDVIVTNLHETGTYQQLYKNWFEGESPDIR